MYRWCDGFRGYTCDGFAGCTDGMICLQDVQMVGWIYGMYRWCDGFMGCTGGVMDLHDVHMV